MKRQGEWIHISEVESYRVSSVREFRNKLNPEPIVAPEHNVVTLLSLVKTAAEPGRTMRSLVAA